MEENKLVDLIRACENSKIRNMFSIDMDAPDDRKSPKKLGQGVCSVFRIKMMNGAFAAMKVSEDPESYGRLVGYKNADGEWRPGEIELLKEIGRRKGLSDGFVKFIGGPYDLQTSYSYVLLELGDEDLENMVFNKKRQGVRFSCRDAADLMTTLCIPLEEAYKIGIVHRDIKASNAIMFGNVPKWCDLSEAGTVGSKTTQKLRGTLIEMAPEVLLDPALSKKEQATVYPLGTLLYHILAGDKMYAEVNIAKHADLKNDQFGIKWLANLKQDKDKNSPNDLERRLGLLKELGVEEYLIKAITIATKPNPEDRYPTIGDFRGAMDRKRVMAIDMSNTLYRNVESAYLELKGAEKDEHGVLKDPHLLDAMIKTAKNFIRYATVEGEEYLSLDDRVRSVKGTLKKIADEQYGGVTKVYVPERGPTKEEMKMPGFSKRRDSYTGMLKENAEKSGMAKSNRARIDQDATQLALTELNIISMLDDMMKRGHSEDAAKDHVKEMQGRYLRMVGLIGEARSV